MIIEVKLIALFYTIILIQQQIHSTTITHLIHSKQHITHFLSYNIPKTTLYYIQFFSLRYNSFILYYSILYTIFFTTI